MIPGRLSWKDPVADVPMYGHCFHLAAFLLDRTDCRWSVHGSDSISVDHFRPFTVTPAERMAAVIVTQRYNSPFNPPLTVGRTLAIPNATRQPEHGRHAMSNPDSANSAVSWRSSLTQREGRLPGSQVFRHSGQIRIRTSSRNTGFLPAFPPAGTAGSRIGSRVAANGEHGAVESRAVAVPSGIPSRLSPGARCGGTEMQARNPATFRESRQKRSDVRLSALPWLRRGCWRLPPPAPVRPYAPFGPASR